jgi:hypothetical protein
MQRSHWLRGLALAVGLLVTQCFDSLSDDCTKTLTCEDDQGPTLREDCTWRYPNQQLWLGAPEYDAATKKWRWPDGKETDTQTFDCDLGDAGTDAGPAGPDCRVNITCDEGQVCDPATGACVECAADIDCAGNMPMGDAGAARVCDTASHRCVECLVNQNCSGDTSVCKVDAANSRRNACVECTDSTTCTNPAEPICDDRANDCTSACQVPADCTGDKKACNTTRSICVECTDNGTCTNADEPLCDTESNLCVECLDDGQCAGNDSARVCDPESHTCVECREDAQCLAGPNAAVRGVCDLDTKICVGCLNDQQCTLGAASRCNVVAHECTGCTNSNQCENNANCNTMTGRCVQCVTDPDCAGVSGKPFCEGVSGTCVECLLTSECRSEELARCETTPSSPDRYTCVGCIAESDCSGKGLPGLCNVAGGGICVNCLGLGPSADCLLSGINLSRCQSGDCVVCTQDEDCGLFADAPDNAPVCKAGVGCVECVDSDDCAAKPGTTVCKTVAGTNPDEGAGPAAVNTCVECTEDEQCQLNAAASRCFNNECVPCAADADCALVDSNGSDPGGIPLNLCDAGTCVECTGVRREICGVNVCNSATKRCDNTRPLRSAALCDDCVSDFECAEDARCVQQTSGGTNIGFFCVPLPTGTPPSCNPRRPFAGAAQLNTLDTPGLTSVCTLRQTTCPGLDDRTEDCDQDTNCGAANVADGLCVAFGGGNVCTIPCISEFDCNVGADCSSGGCEL